MAISVPVVLVVGADAHFCYLVRRYAEQAALAVKFAYQGEDPLAVALREQPAVILLETDTSAGGHRALLRAFKSDPRTAPIPVVLCSWRAQADMGREDGAAASLQKPLLYNAFLQVLAQVGLKA